MTTREGARAQSPLTGPLGSGQYVPAPAESRGTQVPAFAEGGLQGSLQPHLRAGFVGTQKHPLNLILFLEGLGRGN